MRQLTQGIRRLCYSSPRITTRLAGMSCTDWTVQRWSDVSALQDFRFLFTLPIILRKILC